MMTSRVTASGILPVNQYGIYVALQQNARGDATYTDFGGKMTNEDIYTYVTATREFNEETYHFFNLGPGWTREAHKEVTIESPNPLKKYKCHVVQMDVLGKYMDDGFEDIQSFNDVRYRIVKQFGVHSFPVVAYAFIPFGDLRNPDFLKMSSYRLKKIMATLA